MKKAVALVLVFLAVLSSGLFAETLDCQQSFELGKINAKEEHRFWWWYFLGVGSLVSTLGLVWPVANMDSGNPWLYPLVIGSLVVTIAPFVPALLFPKRENISLPFGAGDEVDLECYRDGYIRKARMKNAGAVLLGNVTTQGALYVVGMIVFIVAFTGF